MGYISSPTAVLFACFWAAFAMAQVSDPCLMNLKNEALVFGFNAPRFDGIPLRQWKVKTVDMMAKCLTSIPFSSSDALKTIEALQEYLHFYPFLDINRNSGAPYNLSVSTDHDLQELKAQVLGNSTLSSSYDFHVAVKAIIQQARDGHFHYSPPKGFGAFFVVQPLSLVAKQDDKDKDNLRFFVKEDVSLEVHDYYHSKGEKLAQYKGREVLAIDGVPTLDYLRSLARMYPMSKDEGINFNYMLFHAFTFRGQRLPDSDTVRFTFAPRSGQTKAEDFNVHYLAFDANQAKQTRIAQNRYQVKSCGRKRSADNMQTITELQREQFLEQSDEWHSNSPLRDHFNQRQLIQNLLNEHPASRKRSIQGASEEMASDFKTIYASNIEGYALMTYKQRNLVLQLRSFLPGSKGDGFWGAPLNWMMAHAHEYDRILVDFSDNVGGIVCLGEALTNLLTGMRVTDVHDVRRTQLYSKYIPRMPVRTLQGGTYYLSSVFFNEDRQYVRGGRNGSYTTPFAMYCDDAYNALKDAIPKKRIPHDKIIMITNGVSISTASVFAKSMHGLGMKSMTFGGLPNRPMSTSYSIGNPVVVDSNSMRGLFACSGASAKFPRLPNSAQLGFPFAQEYEFTDAVVKKMSPREARVAEFVLNEATFHFNHWDDSDTSAIYDAAISFMG